LEIRRQHLDEYADWAEEHSVELALLNGPWKDVKPSGYRLAQAMRDHDQAIKEGDLTSPPAGQLPKVIE
jgi:hypothetical protein